MDSVSEDGSTVLCQGVVRHLADIFGADSFKRGNEKTRFKAMIDSGCSLGSDLQTIWNELRVEISTNDDVFPGLLGVEAESAGFYAGELIEKPQRDITAKREESRVKDLELRIAALPDRDDGTGEIRPDQRRVAYFSQNDTSHQHVSSVPSRGNEIMSSQVYEAHARLYGLPSPICKPYVGKLIGRTGRRMDRYANNLTAVTLPGDGWRKHHNNLLWVLYEFAAKMMGATDISAEIFGLFSPYIQQLDQLLQKPTRARQGLVPDLRWFDVDRTQVLGDVKTISVCKTRYKNSDFRVGKKAEAVNRREQAVHREYHRKARDVDKGYNNTEDGQTGPVQGRLMEFGRVRGLVFGGFAESSDDVATLIGTIATVGASRHWADMGCRNVLEARGAIIAEVRRAVGIEAARSAATLVMERVVAMRGDLGAAAARRAKGRASWGERRNYRARMQGFARAQHFNQGGSRRSHR